MGMGHHVCCVTSCTNNARNSSYKFYTFPRAPWKLDKRKLWIDAVAEHQRNIDGSPWYPRPHDTICSAHFVGGKKAEETASQSYVPSIFPWNGEEIDIAVSGQSGEEIQIPDSGDVYLTRNPEASESTLSMMDKECQIHMYSDSTSRETTIIYDSLLRPYLVKGPQPSPGPSSIPVTKTTGGKRADESPDGKRLPPRTHTGDTRGVVSATRDSNKPQDPLSLATEQCRFCGEFSKECVSVTDMPYLSTNRTTLSFNDVVVQLDFNDDTLPKTVCRDCDVKLKEMLDFAKVVRYAQKSLINVELSIEFTRENVEDDRKIIVTLEPQDETEMLLVKTEYEDNVEKHDEENEENKKGFADSLKMGETAFIKENVAQKRKGNTTSADKSKKAKATKSKSDSENIELIIDIKEEVVERENTNDDDNNIGCSFSDTGPDVKPREIELAKSALVFEMRSDGASAFVPENS